MTHANPPVPAAVPGAAIRSLVRTILHLVSSGSDNAKAQREAAFAFFVRVASAGVLYLSQVTLARLMGGSEYGIYVFVWTLVLVLSGLSHLGLNTAVIRLLSRYEALGEHGLARGLLRGSRLVVMGFASIVASIGFVILWAAPGIVSSAYVLPVFLGLVCIPMAAVSDVQDGIGRARGWIATALLPPYVLRPLLVLAGMLLAYQCGLPMDAATAVGAAIAATWAGSLVQALLIRRKVRTAFPSAERQYQYKNWLIYSLPLAITAFCEIVFQNTDILVISHYLTPEDAGIYYASAKTMSLIMFVHYAVGSAVANRFASLDARGDREGLEALVRNGVRWTFWPSLAAAALILAVGQPLLSLFGDAFVRGYPVMLIMVVGFLLRSAMGPIEFLLSMLGQQRACAAVLICSAALNIVLNVWLVPAYGMTGAAFATATSFGLAALANYLVAWRVLNIRSAIWHGPPAAHSN